MNGTVRLGEREIPYTVRPSRRARRVSLRIREAGLVEVVVPAHLVLSAPETVLKRHAPWIFRTFDRLTRSGLSKGNGRPEKAPAFFFWEPNGRFASSAMTGAGLPLR